MSPLRPRPWTVTIAAVAVLAFGERPAVLQAQADLDTPTSASILSLLPDGLAKRTFILDCTGCHQMDVARAFPNGTARTEEDWRTIVERMIGMFGPASGFPIISAERDGAATAAWLAEHLREPPKAEAADASDAAIREYDYPYPGDLPHDLIVDPAGRPVITGMFTNRMLVLNPESGTYDEVEIPVPQANPRALELDDRGNWWVLLGAAQSIARYDVASKTWDSWPIDLYGHSVRLDDAGRAWFNGHFTSDPPTMGYLDPDAGTIEMYDVPRTPPSDAENPIPYGLRVAGDGSVWATELHGNRLVRLDPASGAIDAWSFPTSHSGPRRLDVGDDGIVWTPQYAADAVASFDPATERFVEYPLPISGALPYIVRLDTEGRVVVGTGAADAVLRFDPAMRTWETFVLPTRGVLIRHMDFDKATGDLWVAYGASPGIPAKIARLGLGQR